MIQLALNEDGYPVCPTCGDYLNAEVTIRWSHVSIYFDEWGEQYDAEADGDLEDSQIDGFYCLPCKFYAKYEECDLPKGKRSLE
jgi:hypothetical protein